MLGSPPAQLAGVVAGEPVGINYIIHCGSQKGVEVVTLGRWGVILFEG